MIGIVLVTSVGLAALRIMQALPGADMSGNLSVAVLPFEDMSGNPDLAYFGEGVGGDIIAMLARVPNLAVVARSSSFQYKRRSVNLRQMGDELGAHIKQYREAWGKDTANLQEYDYMLRVLSRIAIGTPEAAERADIVLKEGLSRFPESSLLKAQQASTFIWRFARGWKVPLVEIRRASQLAREVLGDAAASPMLRLNAHVSLAYAPLAERRFEQALGRSRGRACSVAL